MSQAGGEKLWGGRFTEQTDQFVEAFTASVNFDRRMYRQDIAGSKAHARMLAETGVITQADRDAIVTGLGEIEAEIEAATSSSQIHGLMSWVLTLDLVWGLSGTSPDQLIPRALEAGRTAIALDQNNEQAHACLSLSLWVTGRHEEALSAARAVRRGVREPEEGDAEPRDLPAVVTDAASRVARDERARALIDAIEALDEIDRAVVVLRGIEQRSNAEAALQLGLQPNTCAARFSRALDKLRQQLPGTLLEEL